jgi:hypothetical protein
MWRTSTRGLTQFSVENGQPADIALHSESHDRGQVLLTFGVAGGARQVTAPRPATVAVHDAGNVQAMF